MLKDKFSLDLQAAIEKYKNDNAKLEELHGKREKELKERIDK